MTQRRRGRPRGPKRDPYRTTLLPEARAELTRRAVERFKSTRATNRVIEEAMGFAAVQLSETEDVAITIERDEWTADAIVTVRLNLATREGRVESAKWETGTPGLQWDVIGLMTDRECARAVEAAWRKREES